MESSIICNWEVHNIKKCFSKKRKKMFAAVATRDLTLCEPTQAKVYDSTQHIFYFIFTFLSFIFFFCSNHFRKWNYGEHRELLLSHTKYRRKQGREYIVKEKEYIVCGEKREFVFSLFFGCDREKVRLREKVH